MVIHALIALTAALSPAADQQVREHAIVDPIPLDDEFPPAPTDDLVATANSDGSVSLDWTSTGDDFVTGACSGYLVRFSDAAPAGDDVEALSLWFEGAPDELGITTGKSAGEAVHALIPAIRLSPGRAWYFALETYDDQRNLSGVSTLADVVTAGPAGPPPGSSPAPTASPDPGTPRSGQDRCGNSASAAGLGIAAAAALALLRGLR